MFARSSLRSTSLGWLSALVLLAPTSLVGCGNGASPSAASTATAASSASPAKSASSAASTATPAPSAAPVATASAAASAEAGAFTASAEPELEEWGKAREIKVPGSGKNSCETKLVREWLRVMCVNRAPDLGVPSAIEVTKGRGPKERSKGENLHAVNDITTLVVPVRPGSDIEATFSWTQGSHVLTATWPAGAPESERSIRFDNADDTAPAVSASVTPEASLPAPEAPIDDVAGIAEAPKDDDWQKAAEVRFSGSTAAGCETKVSGDWFRARCANPDKKVDSIVAVKGHHKTQTKITVADGVATFVTPFVEGTETWARFKSGDTTRTLVLRWKKGPRPETAGSFESGH